MGEKPSSAVQQSAYLEALDQYIDYDHDGQVRKCLLDKNGKRLLDSNGSPKTLRHKFAVYCDDIYSSRGRPWKSYFVYSKHSYVVASRPAYKLKPLKSNLELGK